jgi:PPOX class probable F420-dependent enzyme
MRGPEEHRVELGPALGAFLDAPRFAVLATKNADGSAHLTVIWYERDGAEILMNTRAGRVKDRNLRRDPRFALCVEDGYRFVSLNGVATTRDADQARAEADILRLGIRYDGQKEAERQTRELWSTQARVTYRLRIERILAVGF